MPVVKEEVPKVDPDSTRNDKPKDREEETGKDWNKFLLSGGNDCRNSISDEDLILV